jgi:hypothetical protein
MPVPASHRPILLRARQATNAAASTGIQVASRVSESRTMAPIHSGSQRRPRSRVRIAAPSAAVWSARPQLSVSGSWALAVRTGSRIVATVTALAVASRKRSSSSPKMASTHAT